MARDFRARVMQTLLENPDATVIGVCAIVEAAAFMEGRPGNELARYHAEFAELARQGKIINTAPAGSECKTWRVAEGATWRRMKSTAPRDESLPVASPLVCDDSLWPKRQAPAGLVEEAMASMTELERAWRTIPASPSS